MRPDNVANFHTAGLDVTFNWLMPSTSIGDFHVQLVGGYVNKLEFIPVPGASDEHAFLYLGLVDASAIPERAGAADEKEATRPMRVPIDTALAALGQGTMRNGFLLMALQWLALNRDRLDTIVAGPPAVR